MLLRTDEIRFNNGRRYRAEIDSVNIVTSAVAALGVIAGSTNTRKIHDIALIALAEEEKKPTWLFIGLIDPNLKTSSHRQPFSTLAWRDERRCSTAIEKGE